MNDTAMDTSMRPNTSSAVTSITSPGRSGGSEDIVRDGVVDLNQLNRILKNPELPKSRLQMNRIVRQHDEEMRRARTLQRIHFRHNHFNSGLSDHPNRTNAPNPLPTDLDQLKHFDVNLDQLPHELLINILGETFAKYETAINSRNDKPFNEWTLQSATKRTKGKPLPDEEDECVIIDDNCVANDTIGSLEQKHQKLMTEYESIEKEENVVSKDSQRVSEELEERLATLRECIAFCETLKERNICLNEKQNDLKDRKLKLKDEMKAIDQRLRELKTIKKGSNSGVKTESIDWSKTSQMNAMKRQSDDLNAMKARKEVTNKKSNNKKKTTNRS